MCDVECTRSYIPNHRTRFDVLLANIRFNSIPLINYAYHLFLLLLYNICSALHECFMDASTRAAYNN